MAGPVKSLFSVAGPNASLKDAGSGGGEEIYLPIEGGVAVLISTIGGETGLALKPDGTRFYKISGSNNLNQYDVVDPFDITNVTNYVSENNLSGLTTAQGLVFKPDGTSFYVLDNSTDALRQYDMSTAFDIRTYSAGSVFSVSTQEASPRGLAFRTDGTAVYVGGVSSYNKVHVYSLSTAWDVSTMSFVETFDLSSILNSTLNGVGFSPDGEVFYASQNVTVFRAALSTPWDISTAVFDANGLGKTKVLSVGNFAQFTVHPEGKALFFADTNDDNVVIGIRGIVLDEKTYVLRGL
ncbi:beta-propeller fold lactonase family protein [Phaeobacter gallaeciensis]|uniref:YncE family protein n=1 Tax=Phaeobacter gallaeciensis TaxID=60890 RepID=UPI00237FBD79|nr:beta-propeller fold lactonase family protein [Phaeobacter gallaeciensis]MDE4302844.1 beta-propeller fold lactonase family protein [Phaeobacter gallaeciensis]MDE4307063.1 beta-propeller fold lactonase family protein [Phaeobacter gallaeciensis]MDE4311528.1 beta-propeller fold lactonase family protein [Phaeobacter gallaeciensis]MDE4316165.1 beta-propeller fold lactonase family protein [Phaeobacter gallaeciensis]MDE4320455.1 beta-propeller fold lactonase family protein [Phaeobacter gallaeciensi